MQFTQPLKDDFRCQVCKEPWDPDQVVMCADCQTIFCKPCYDEAMVKDNTCHSCSKAPANFVAVHRLVRSMAENLQVYCKYKCHGCGWTGARSQFNSHTTGCDKKPREFTYVAEDAIPKELLCPICVVPFTDPVQLPCEHILCRQCATDSLGRNSLCPVDRSPASVDGFTEPPKLITSLLDELPVYCANRKATPNPCSWEGRRRDYLGHKTVCKGGKPSDDLIRFAPPPVTPSDTSKMQVETFSEFPTIEASNVAQDIYALAHVTAPKMETLEQRKKPLSISAVIDVSGSMSGTKLNMAKDSLRFMIDELSDRDELGIITFHTDIAEPFQLAKMTEDGKRRAHAAVDTLRALSCTNLSGGLFAGMDQVCRKPFAASGRTCGKTTKRSSSFMAGASDLFHRMCLAGGLPAATFPTTDPLLTACCYVMKRDGKTRFVSGLQAKAKGLEDFVQSVTVSLNGETKTQAPSSEFSFEHDSPPATYAVTFRFESRFKTPDYSITFAAPAQGATIAKVPNVALVAVGKASPAPTATNDSCRAVLLFTDGVANNGITIEDEFASALRSRLPTLDDMVIHTFGFGADHNARLLQNLSQIGAGSYYFIQDVSTMKESFADCLGGLLSTVAQNITVEVVPQNGFAIDRLMTTLKHEVKDGRAVVTMRDVYSGEQRDVLVKLKMQAPSTVGTTADLVQFTVHYDSLLSASKESVSAVCRVGVVATKSTEPPNKTLEEQRARVLATEALEAARRDADRGDVAGARERLKCQKEAIRKSTVAQTAFMDAMMNDMDEIEEDMVSESKWNAFGSKACAQKATSHQLQRQCAAVETAAFGYDNSFKAGMRSKARK